MDNKLTLEQITIYLAHKLVCLDHNGNKLRLYTGCDEDFDVHKHGLLTLPAVISGRVKPLLNPLTNLTTDAAFLQFCKEQITCADLRVDEYASGPIWLLRIEILGNHDVLLAVDGEVMAECPLLFYQWMVKHHYDVNNLIGAGLAVDINSINK